MPYEFKFPFEPPWEDLKLELEFASGAKCYVFDTLCKNVTQEQKDAAMEHIGDIVYRDRVQRLARGEDPNIEVKPYVGTSKTLGEVVSRKDYRKRNQSAAMNAGL